MKKLLLFTVLLFSYIVKAQNCVERIVTSDDSFTVHLQDGTTYTWGSNQFGQLGTGNTNSVTTLQPTVNGAQWSTVKHARMHTIALDQDGNLWAWGNNAAGQLGTGSSAPFSYTPMNANSSGWATISAGNLHSVGLKNDGTMWGWGNNGAMELSGNGSTTYYTSPIQISPDTDWESIYAGYFKTFGIKTDGTLWARGRNNLGDLGNGTAGAVMAFTQIGTDNDWTKISCARASATFGLKTNHTLWAWGNNENGRLGTGSAANQYSPTQIPGEWKDISSGNIQTIGIKMDGTLWTWGSYGWVEGGVMLIPDSNVPVQMGTDNDWISVEAAYSASFAIKADHSLWAWGYNGNGWLADGTMVSKATPVMIVGCTNLANPDLRPDSISVYPNPAKESIRWNMERSVKSFRIVNVLGQTVKSGMPASAEIGLWGISDGMYVLLLETYDGKIHISKFIKQ